MDEFNAGQWLAGRLAWERVLNEWRRRAAEDRTDGTVPVRSVAQTARHAKQTARLRRRTAAA